MQVDEISLLAPSWYVSIQVQPYGSTVPSLTNLVHFTANNEDNSEYGSRIPAIFFKENSRKLVVCSAVNQNKNYCYTSPKDLPVDEYTTVEVSQIQFKGGPLNGKYELQIKINGTTVHNVENAQPRFFGNVKVYRSDRWYTTPNALIKNFVCGNLPYGKSCFSVTEDNLKVK